MLIKLAPSLLLSVLCCSDEVAAFNAVRPAVTSRTAAAPRRTARPVSSNDFDADFDVEVENVPAVELNRRAALARFAATAGAAFLGGNRAAMAVDPAAAATPEFSPSPTSEASIARMGYDGKALPAPPAEPSAPPAEAEAPPATEAPPAEEKSVPSDFDGNEAGPVGATDEGTQPPKKPIVGVAVDRTRLDPSISLPSMTKLVENLSEVDPKIVVGGVALVSVLALAGGGEEDDGTATIPPVAKATGTAPPAEPYGMAGGRNYWDGVDMAAAKNAGLVVPPPPTPKPVAVEKVEEEAVDEEPKPEEKKPSWVLDKPVPYGIQNKSSNPFIKEVLEYCEGGKVSEPCAESIKGYLDDLADTGAAASSSDAKVIAGYMDTLGAEAGDMAPGKKAGAAFTSYLDALSGGSAPPPSSAKAVKTYLDVLSGAAPAPVADETPVAQEVEESAPEPAVLAPEWPDMSEYDDRITSIEGRVTTLETKVDQIPDQVFAKVEAWQSSNEERLSAEVKKIVEALTPPPPVEPVAVAEELPPAPEPVVEPVAEVPEPVQESEPEAPVVPATPIGAIPPRSSMPQPMEGGTKKRYGFGGGAAWKVKSDASPAPSEPMEYESEPVVEPVAEVLEPVPEPEPEAPVVPATPIGAIPPRSSMPQPMEGGFKKTYGFGGGAAWKTNSDSMPPPVEGPKKGYGFGSGASWKTGQ